MLHYLRLILSTIVFCCLLGILAYLPSKTTAQTIAQTKITVFMIGSTTYVMDGIEQTMNVAPYIKDDRTYLPLRYAAYALGVKNHNIFWDGFTGTVTLIEDGRDVQLIIGETIMIVNDTRISIDSAPEIVNGRVMVPLRWIIDAFEAELYWDPVTQTITITAVDQVMLPDVQPVDIQPVDVQPVDVIERHFSWYYQGRYWSYQIQISEAIYNYYANLERPLTADYHYSVDYSVYVTHPLDDTIIASIAEHFDNIAWQQGFSPEQTINFVAAFVQSLEYVCDPGLGGPYEYPRYPLETLVDQRGDCEDTSILLAAILDAMGFDVILVYVAPPAHMAVGITGEDLFGFYYEYSGRKYYYLETTDPGWEVGEVPEEYRAPAELKIFSLIPRPVITHDWNAETTLDGWLELEVTVYNGGTATARDVVVLAALDAGQGLVYDYYWSDKLDVGPHSTATYTIYLELPRNTSTRLIVETFSEGQLQDESTSDWFST